MTRKEQVLALVAEGKTTPQIAALLGVSEATVRYHREPSKQQPSLRKMVSYLYKRAVKEDGAKVQFTVHDVRPNPPLAEPWEAK